MSSIELRWCSRSHFYPECDVLHVWLTHYLIPALGLVWFVAVHQRGRQKCSRKGVLRTEMGLKGELCPQKTQLDSDSCKLLASMLMDKRVLLNKRRKWSFVSGVGHWVAWLGCLLTSSKGARHNPLLNVIELTINHRYRCSCADDMKHSGEILWAFSMVLKIHTVRSLCQHTLTLLKLHLSDNTFCHDFHTWDSIIPWCNCNTLVDFLIQSFQSNGCVNLPLYCTLWWPCTPKRESVLSAD